MANGRIFLAALAMAVLTTGSVFADPGSATPAATVAATPTPEPTPVFWKQSAEGETAIFPMGFASYPHVSRSAGWTNRAGKYFGVEHYTDSSVALFIPKGYTPGPKTNLIFYWHGHVNNVAKALDQFTLREKILAAGKNAILVCPEGPKDAPDSGGGKLEDAGGLQRLANEVMLTLQRENKIPQGTSLGDVALTGHSGAYKIIGMVLRYGGLESNVKEVYLIDSSYGQLEDFVSWMVRHPEGRFVSIFTEHLADENAEIMKGLKDQKVEFTTVPDEEVTTTTLTSAKRLFLPTKTLTHNETVSRLSTYIATGGLDPLKK